MAIQVECFIDEEAKKGCIVKDGAGNRDGCKS